MAEKHHFQRVAVRDRKCGLGFRKLLGHCATNANVATKRNKMMLLWIIYRVPLFHTLPSQPSAQRL